MREYVQGDVIFNKIDKLPEGVVQLPTKVLQLGEVTGHKHQFLGNAAVSVFIDKAYAGNTMTITPDEGKFVVVMEPSALVHEEHRPQTIDPGIYQIDIVREFNYDKMEAARVVD